MHAESYSGAVDHYLSPRRHDAVKTWWEEPATQRIIDATLAHVSGEGPLRVLDVGCGTGDALRLLRTAPQSRHRSLDPDGVHYTGLDINPELLEAARWLYRDNKQVEFVRDDIREWEPQPDAPPFDVFLSTGVPYSHLSPAELQQVLVRMFTAARRNPRPTALVIDVLGRYSIEWSPRWDQQRWPYNMSFFATDHAATDTDMTFYSGPELCRIITDAAARAGCSLGGLDCYDRSIMVGRHTTTGAFAPGLRPYRQLVNELFDPDLGVELDRLRCEVQLPDAPEAVTQFWVAFGKRWNALVDDVAGLSRAVGDPEHAARVLQPMLARGLQQLETTYQQGLGVGHSLTAVAHTQTALS